MKTHTFDEMNFRQQIDDDLAKIVIVGVALTGLIVVLSALFS